MLQPRRNLTRRKRAGSRLDPENKCIIGQVFLKVLRSENERKENEKRKKEEKRKEGERVLRRKEREKGNIFVCLESLILSFPCNFFAYFKFHSDWGRVIGKIKQNEVDCHDIAPLIAYSCSKSFRNQIWKYPLLYNDSWLIICEIWSLRDI